MAASPAPVDTTSIGYRLATLTAGHAVDADDPNIEAFESIVSSIQAKYGCSPEHVADIIVMVSNELQERGRDEDLLSIAQGLHTAVMSAPDGQSLEDASAAYIILVIGGK